MFYIFFHHFRPSLFLGHANRTQSPARDRIDSRVILTLAPGRTASLNELLHNKGRTYIDELAGAWFCHCLSLIRKECVLLLFSEVR